MNVRPSLHPSSALDATATQVRIAIVGFGLHAARTYAKHIEERKAAGDDIDFRLVVDCTNARDEVTSRVAKLPSAPDIHLVTPFTDAMPLTVEAEMNRLVRRHRINAVIVSTIPEAHRAWVEWAIRNDLCVLVDKPFSTRHNAVSDLHAARAIANDIKSTVAEYGRAKQRARICVMMNLQRRKHPAYRFIEKLIAEVADRTGTGVSYLSAHHGDGQFRLPGELLGIDYHGYNGGNGKLSHSGMHLLDMAYRFHLAGWRSHNRPDTARICSSFTSPAALLTHIPEEFYAETFGGNWPSASPYTREDVHGVADRLGEMDALMRIEFERDGQQIGAADISVLHNSVSQRAWLHPKANLYKGQGRIKGERWLIASGPFQEISLEVRQAEDQHDGEGPKSYEPGGPNHMQISVVRNAGVLGGEKIQVLQAHELGAFDHNRLHSEEAKMASLVEFVDFVAGKIGYADIESDLSDHVTTACWMSAAYESHVRRQLGRSRFVSVSLRSLTGGASMSTTRRSKT